MHFSFEDSRNYKFNGTAETSSPHICLAEPWLPPASNTSAACSLSYRPAASPAWVAATAGSSSDGDRSDSCSELGLLTEAGASISRAQPSSSEWERCLRGGRLGGCSLGGGCWLGGRWCRHMAQCTAHRNHTVNATKHEASTAKSCVPWGHGRCGVQHPPELAELAAQRGRLVGRVCPVQACGAGRGTAKWTDGKEGGLSMQHRSAHQSTRHCGLLKRHCKRHGLMRCLLLTSRGLAARNAPAPATDQCRGRG